MLLANHGVTNRPALCFKCSLSFLQPLCPVHSLRKQHEYSTSNCQCHALLVSETQKKNKKREKERKQQGKVRKNRKIWKEEEIEEKVRKWNSKGRRLTDVNDTKCEKVCERFLNERVWVCVTGYKPLDRRRRPREEQIITQKEQAVAQVCVLPSSVSTSHTVPIKLHDVRLSEVTHPHISSTGWQVLVLHECIFSNSSHFLVSTVTILYLWDLWTRTDTHSIRTNREGRETVTYNRCWQSLGAVQSSEQGSGYLITTADRFPVSTSSLYFNLCIPTLVFAFTIN